MFPVSSRLISVIFALPQVSKSGGSVTDAIFGGKRVFSQIVRIDFVGEEGILTIFFWHPGHLLVCSFSCLSTDFIDKNRPSKFNLDSCPQNARSFS